MDNKVGGFSMSPLNHHQFTVLPLRPWIVTARADPLSPPQVQFLTSIVNTAVAVMLALSELPRHKYFFTPLP